MRNYRKMNGDNLDPVKARYWETKKRRRENKVTRLAVLIARALGRMIPESGPQERVPVGARGGGSRGCINHRLWKRRRASGWDQ